MDKFQDFPDPHKRPAFKVGDLTNQEANSLRDRIVEWLEKSGLGYLSPLVYKCNDVLIRDIYLEKAVVVAGILTTNFIDPDDPTPF